MNIIAGILLPQSGSVKVNDIEITTLSDQKRRDYRSQNIGFVFQDFKLIPYLKVIDNILLPYRINDNLKLDDSIKKSVVELAEELGIAHKLSKYICKTIRERS